LRERFRIPFAHIFESTRSDAGILGQGSFRTNGVDRPGTGPSFSSGAASSLRRSALGTLGSEPTVVC
jgi:hypothetical protein